MPEAKTTNTFIEKTLLASKAKYNEWKNGTALFYKMPEAKKTNTFIEKALLASKTLTKIHTKQRHSAALQNDWSQKTNTFIEKTNVGSKTLQIPTKSK